MKSNSRKHLGRRLMAILLTAVMTCSVLTPTSIFAAPAQPEELVSAADKDIQDILSDAADEAEAAQLQATELVPAPIEESEASPASIGSYQRRNGYFTYQVTVGEEKREAEVYIPIHARQREYWVVIALPNGVNSVEFMNSSGWFSIADNNLTCLLILKPEEGTWGTIEEEMPYVNACMSTLVSNGTYYSAFTYDYLAGYGEGCAFLQLWAEQNPLKMISQAYVGAKSDEALLEQLRAAGDTQVGETPQPNHMDFVGFTSRGSYVECTDKDGKPVTQKRSFEAVYNRDLAIPTYLYSKSGETDIDLAEFWLGVNWCDSVPDITGSPLGNIYVEDEDSNCITTSYSDVRTSVAIGETDLDFADPDVTARVFAYLTTYSGYDNNSAYGHFITYRLDYAEAIGAGNLVYKNHVWNETNRVYEIYIPDTVKGNADLAANAPVVFANHGAGQTAFVFMEATDIKEAADKYGFIAVTFDLTGNAQYMVDLIELVKADCAELGITVDESRFYAYGQSAGGGATANTLSQNLLTVDKFAAFGYTSGTQASVQDNGVQSIVPVYAIYGEYDYWPNKLGPLEAGDWCGSQGASQAGWTVNTQSYWANRLLGMTIDELVDPANYTLVDGISSVYEVQNTPVSIIVNPTEEVNRYKTCYWSTDTGSGEAPIFAWSQCYGRGHNLVPSDLDQLWENWFSKWQLADNATLYYADGVGNGEAVSVTRVLEPETPEAQDFDAIEGVQNDLSVSALLPVKGWYTKAIDVNGDGEMNDGRSVKLYASQYAACRAYYTIVAVPNDVDTYQFLDEQGWIDLIENRGEVLVALEPGEGGWGSVEDELGYVNAAMAFVNSGNNAKGVTLLSNYTTFYFVGYGEGAAPLESWAAETPIYVGSQAYIGGPGAGEAYLAETGAKIYDGTNTGGYDPGIADLEVFEGLLKEEGYAGAITRSEVAVPTLFAGYAADDYSIGYWKNANDVLPEADEDGVFWQALDSDAFQTDFANARLASEDAGHGISAVKIVEEAGNAEELASFLYGYSRYNIPFAYSNHISERQDYTAARVAAQKAAAKNPASESNYVAYDKPYTADTRGTVYEGYHVMARERSEIETGIFESGIIAVADNNNDGTLDATEYLLYIPNNVADKAPIVFQFPGATQSVSVGFDSTQWWRIANQYGIVVVILSECYGATSIRLGWNNADVEFVAVRDIIQKNVDGIDCNIDWSRVYGSGHSAGSGNAQRFVRTHPDFFAAVGSTSMGNTTAGDYTTVPDILITGQSDLGQLMPNLWENASLQNWFAYLAKANGVDAENATAENADEAIQIGRTYLWKWNNGQDIPVIAWGQTMFREHNCYPGEVPIIWDFISRFCMDEDGGRYYSASAFAEDDLVKLEKPAPEAQDFDAIESADIDLGVSALIPLSGYFTKTIQMEDAEDRTVKLYFSDVAACRAYFTIVAVPDGVDTYEFLDEQGWIDLINERGEVLVALEPGTGGWGSAAEEMAYVNAAMAFVNSGKNAKEVTLFTNYSTFYFVGYGKGAAALETWSAKNPTYIDSQAFIGGEGAGKEFIDEAGAQIYDGTNTGGYDRGIADLDEFKAVLNGLGYDDVISRKDVPVPTWFDNYDYEDYSIAYWKAANDVAAEADEQGVFWQDINSDAFQTEYDNSWRARLGETTGLSKVRVTTANGTPSAEDLAAFLYGYSRYNIPFAYSNHLSERQDYTAARVAAQKAAAQKAINESTFIAYDDVYLSDADKPYEGYNLLARERSEGKNGIFESGIFATADDNDDGVLDAREYLMYIPSSAAEATEEIPSDHNKMTPVVFQFPGMTQSVSVGFDSTQWWRIADEYGVIIVILGEVYNNGVALSWKNSDTEYMAVMDILGRYIDGKDTWIDWERIYGSGHSLGSAQVQTFVHTHPDFFAAVASTSFGSQENGGNYDAVPTMLAIGQADLPFLMKDLWTSQNLKTWFDYLAKANDLKVAEATPDNADASDTDGRYKMYSWSNKQGIPMVLYDQTYLREHNCYPKEVEFAWDFLSHYGQDGDGKYYSATAFADDDQIKIERQYEGIDLDSFTEAFTTDYSQAAQLPLTGYCYKRLSNNRVAHLYFAEEASIRTYFTVVAVPDGVDTEEFLAESGWYDVADAKGEALLVLEPGFNGWGSAADEYKYVEEAINFVKSGSNANRVAVFSCFGEFYLVGYDKAAAPLELWAATNPIFVIAQAYFNGESLADKQYDEAGAIEYDNERLEEYLEKVGFEGKLKNSQIPVPTWLNSYDVDGGAVAYWKAVNDIVGEPDLAGVYYQDINSAAFATEYANKKLKEAEASHGFSEVRVTSSEEALPAADIYKWMATFTRYDNTLAYSNALAYRMDYTAATVEVQQKAKAEGAKELAYVTTEGVEGVAALWGDADIEVAAKDGLYPGTVNVGVIAFADNSGDEVNDPREYVVYIPDTVKDSGKEAPIVMSYAGNSQTDRIFFDCTLWYQLAYENGFVVIFPCETYNRGGVTVSHYNNDLFYYSMKAALVQEIGPKYGFIPDTTRIYGTGQSAGSGAVQGFVRTHPEFFAAVASTSASGSGSGTQPIPDYLITGKKDNGTSGLGIPASESLVNWAKSVLELNGLDDPDCTNPSFSEYVGRYKTQGWNNKQGITLVKYSLNTFRPHNCYPEDMTLLWDFMKGFKAVTNEDGTITRYYSESGYAEDDAVEIVFDEIPVEEDEITKFVRQLYSEFLGREPDAGGLDAWVSALKDKTTDLAYVIRGFVLSEEFQNQPLDDEAYVTALYHIIFSREPDKGGLHAWLNVLENGATKKKVLSGFVNSDEMKNLAAELGVEPGTYYSDDLLDQNYGVTSFVARLYRNCLGRKYDEKGLRAWVTVLLDGTASASKVATNFLVSPEMEQKELADEELVEALYKTLFDREPDKGGRATWLKSLETRSRASVIASFTESAEFANLCEKFGVRK